MGKGLMDYSQLTNDELLKMFKEQYLKYNIKTSCEYKNNKVKPSLATLNSRLGLTYNELVISCGLEKNIQKNNLKHLTKEKVINYIVNFNDEYGHAPSSNELKDYLGYNINFKPMFGKTYTEFLKEDVEINPKELEYFKWSRMSDSELVELYKNFCNKIGKVATAEDLLEGQDVPTDGVYQVRFGSLKKVRELAGIKTNNPRFNIDRNKYTKIEIMKTLKEKYRENNRRLTQDEITDDKNIPNVNTLCKYFNTRSINKIWEEVEQELIKDYFKLLDKLENK